MRSFCDVLIVCAAAAVFSAGNALAQSDYPNKSIRLVLGFPPGGISDVLARAIGARLSANLGQQVVIDNRPGAGTTIASDIVAKSAPDGYTLFMQDITTHAINASLYKKLPYDTVKDFTPISLVASSALMLVVHPSLPAKSVKELIALAKSRPGQIVYASSGNGTILHLAGETFKSMAGVDMIHVPYKGSAQAVQALLAGEVALTFSTMPPALPQVKSGKLRGLGVTTPKRNAAAPEVPTVSEAGLKGFDVVLYSGVLGPAGMPAAVVSKLNSELAKAVNAAEVKNTYSNLGVDALTDTPEQFAAHIASEIIKLGKAVRAAGAHVD
ncbi:MAG TPA: tripartite tricarboxylate transporter substrate binding protein [Burkholderiales bacterium]|nr:tripartite tricarboxylate transporter substrate binding protein [Burkholderiales bacterium]